MKTALIVIDLIEDYFDAEIWPGSRIPGNRAELVARTNDLVAICRKREVPVFWVRQEFEPDLSNVFGHMRDGARPYAIRGTPGSQLLRELDVGSSDTIVVKHRFSAFFATPLSDHLEGLGIDTVVLAGITTAWCVRSTAVDAYQRDLTVILARECLDGFTEMDHVESLRAMDGYIASALTNQSYDQFLCTQY